MTLSFQQPGHVMNRSTNLQGIVATFGFALLAAAGCSLKDDAQDPGSDSAAMRIATAGDSPTEASGASTPADRRVQLTIADAERTVALKRCDALAGPLQEPCRLQAQADYASTRVRIDDGESKAKSNR